MLYMTKITFISVVNEDLIYKKCILENKFIKDNPDIETVRLSNLEDNKFISVRYNQFIENYDFSSEAWLIFCHSDWEIGEDILPRLDSLNRDSLYGPIGTIITQNNGGVIYQERRGRIYDRKRDGSNLRLMECYNIENGAEVDTFDCQCLIVHSSLIKKYSLRFDGKLEFDLYVEDFCANAKVLHGIRSKILRLDCCHWQQLEDINERPHFFDKVDYINKKYQNYLLGTTIVPIGGNSGRKIEKIINAPSTLRTIADRSAIYHWDVDLNNAFDARVIALNYIEKNATVLDVGCACGDLGNVLKKERDCIVYGMEYNKGSIEIAKKTKSFEEIFQLDLNNFDINDYAQLENKLDYIVFGDVLEHVIDPQNILKSFKKLLKRDGYFIVSLPNIAHASIKAGLLNDEFEYGDVGLLDRTHLRLFTYKSIATFLSEIYLEIKDVKFVPMDINGLYTKDYYSSLSDVIKRHIFSSPHSFVCQYVMKISVADDSMLKINKNNLKQLEMGKNKTPNQILNLMKNRENNVIKIHFMKSQKIRKIIGVYVKYESKVLFLFLSPRKFFKKYLRI